MKSLFLASVLGLGLGSRIYNYDVASAIPRHREPKNKHNLKPEHLELMKDMTPKEKKKFIKGLYK
jgi:hypothetical protein